MNKELEAFNRVSESLLHAVGGIGNAHYIDYSNSVEPAKEDLDIIETALKRLEFFDKVEELPTPNIINNSDGSYEFDGVDELLLVSKNEWEKQLKALEIIKEKKWLVEDILNAFNGEKGKYDLLKEVLK